MPKIRLRKNKAGKISKSLNKGLKKRIFSTKMLAVLLVVLGLVGFGYSTNYWYRNIFLDSDRIFYNMLENSLNTRSVIKTVEQSGSGKTENQTVLIKYTPDVKMRSVNVAEQVAQNRTKSVVETESYSSRQLDYIRYNQISIPATGTNKSDYSKITNTWAKKDNSQETGGQSEFLNEAGFTFVPFGNFTNKERAEIIKKVKDTEVYRFNDVKIIYENGRPVYEALVSLSPRKFVNIMSDYSKKTGIGNPDQLNPSDYTENYNFTIKVKVDVISGQLRQIIYPTGDRIENYASYGANIDINMPKQAISIEELQSRLQ